MDVRRRLTVVRCCLWVVTVLVGGWFLFEFMFFKVTVFLVVELGFRFRVCWFILGFIF